MKIDCRRLTQCHVSSDGETVDFGMIDASGEAAAVTLALDDIGSLAMTLPTVLQKAMRIKHRDPSMRYTYPIGSWKLE